MPSLEGQNRYRREAENLRKAADELARMRQAAEAVLKAAQKEATRTAEEEKITMLANLGMFAEITASTL